MKNILKKIKINKILIFLEIKKLKVKTIVTLLGLTCVMIFVHLYAFGGRETYEMLSTEREFAKLVDGDLTEDKYNWIQNEKKEIENKTSAPVTEEELDEDLYISDVIIENSEEFNIKGKFGKTLAEDKVLLDNALYKCKLVAQMESNKQLIIERAKENLRQLDEAEKYDIAYNEKIIEILQSWDDSVIMLRDNWLSVYLCESKFWIFMVIAQVVILGGIYAREKELGMVPLIKSSGEGKGGYFISKYMTTTLISIFIVIYFQLVELILFGYTYGFEWKYFSYPMRMINTFNDSIYDYSMGELILIYTIVRILIMILLGNIILIISMFAKKTVPAMSYATVTNAILVGIPYWVIQKMIIIENNYTIVSWAMFIKKYVSTAPLGTFMYFTTFNATNIFNIPVSDIVLNSTICVIEIVVLTTIAAMLHRKVSV